MVSTKYVTEGKKKKKKAAAAALNSALVEEEGLRVGREPEGSMAPLLPSWVHLAQGEAQVLQIQAQKHQTKMER